MGNIEIAARGLKRGEAICFTAFDCHGFIKEVRKHSLTNKDLLNANNEISMVFGCYPPNVTKIVNKHIWFYNGLEEGLMCWDSIDKRKFKKELAKLRRVK